MTALIVITVALGIVLIASGVLHILREISHRKRLTNVKRQRDDLNRENSNLYEAIGEQAKTNTRLLDENYTLRRDLTESRATVELLRMPSGHATVPLQEAVKPDAPLSYAEAKPTIDDVAKRRPIRRNMGKKAGQP